MTGLDLASVDHRLRWAAAHSQRVSDLSAEWAGHAVEVSKTDDPVTGLTTYRAEVAVEPPVGIALALSDTLHQSQATLDNLVTVLRGGEPTRTSGFLVSDGPEVFDRDKDGRLTGVPGWAMAAIREVQPFPANPWRHVGEWLDKLHQLAIIDRHHALLIQAGLIDLHEVSAVTSHPVETRFALEDGGRVITLEYPIGAAVHASVGPAIFVAEEPARWRDAGYPPFASAPEVAKQAVLVR